MKVATNNVVQFEKLMCGGVEMIVKACNLYVADIDAHPESKQAYIDTGKWNPRVLASFEDIGRGETDIRLMLNGGKNTNYIKKLPISDQKRIMDGGNVELLTCTGDSLMIDPKTCTSEQAKQIFDGKSIRTPSDQRAYIEAEERGWEQLERTNNLVERYRVRGSKVIVGAACELTKGDLLAMLAEIK